MQRIAILYRQFLREPLWFQLLIIAALLSSIVFSTSLVTMDGYSQSAAKLAAAVFFCAYGWKWRRTTKQISAVFFALTAICLYLAWDRLPLLTQ
ncbi:hypothetical protein J31TS4_19530 [Paenibacillus sp. J31TS4]|nr:hypothetical protein J31TS4_19530 [Paenibacillus sp. J31TS4]